MSASATSSVIGNSTIASVFCWANAMRVAAQWIESSVRVRISPALMPMRHANKRIARSRLPIGDTVSMAASNASTSSVFQTEGIVASGRTCTVGTSAERSTGSAPSTTPTRKNDRNVEIVNAMLLVAKWQRVRMKLERWGGRDRTHAINAMLMHVKKERLEVLERAARQRLELRMQGRQMNIGHEGLRGSRPPPAGDREAQLSGLCAVPQQSRALMARRLRIATASA